MTLKCKQHIPHLGIWYETNRGAIEMYSHIHTRPWSRPKKAIYFPLLLEIAGAEEKNNFLLADGDANKTGKKNKTMNEK